MLTSREFATIFWIGILIFFLCLKKDMRDSLFNLVKICFRGFILRSIITHAVYLTIVIVIMTRLSFWEPDLLKDIFVWFVTIGLINSFNSVTKWKDSGFYKKLIIQNIKLIVVIEFIFSTFTFSLAVELILTPIVTIIVVLQEVSKRNPEHKQVAKLLNQLQTLIGIAFLFFTARRVYLDYVNLKMITTVVSFVLPFTLTIAFLPLAYYYGLKSGYDQIFVRLKINKRITNELRKKVKIKIVSQCGLSLSKVRRFSEQFSMDLVRFRDANEFKTIMHSAKTNEEEPS